MIIKRYVLMFTLVFTAALPRYNVQASLFPLTQRELASLGIGASVAGAVFGPPIYIDVKDWLSAKNKNEPHKCRYQYCFCLYKHVQAIEKGIMAVFCAGFCTAVVLRICISEQWFDNTK